MRRYIAKKAPKPVNAAQNHSFNSKLDSPHKAFKSPIKNPSKGQWKGPCQGENNLLLSPNKFKALVKKLACQLILDIVVQPTTKKQTFSQLSGEIASKVKEFYKKESIISCT